MARRIGIRWTVGDAAPRGFVALGLSIRGAWRLFGEAAAYAVCVNGVSPEEARRRTGPVPAAVDWRASGDLPPRLGAHLSPAMAEGVAWKLAPLRLFPDRWEIALDNDLVLWDLPDATRAWLASGEPCCLVAGDVEAAHAAFADMTDARPRNTGIRGLPPGFDLEAALLAVLRERPVPLDSELDEQGLQVVALDRPRPAYVVSTEDVAITSPFWPKRPELGRCGAHFVGLNVRDVPFAYEGRPGGAWIAECFDRHRPTLERLVGARDGSAAARVRTRSA